MAGGLKKPHVAQAWPGDGDSNEDCWCPQDRPHVGVPSWDQATYILSLDPLAIEAAHLLEKHMSSYTRPAAGVRGVPVSGLMILAKLSGTAWMEQERWQFASKMEVSHD